MDEAKWERGEKCLDFGNSHLARVPFIVEQNVTLHPGNVGFLGANGIMLELDGFTNLIEKFFGLSVHRLI